MATLFAATPNEKAGEVTFFGRLQNAYAPGPGTP